LPERFQNLPNPKRSPASKTQWADKFYYLKRTFKAKPLSHLVQNSIQQAENPPSTVEGTTLNYNRNMAKQTPIIHLQLKKRIGTFEQISSSLEHGQYVPFFQLRQACNPWRAERTSINPRKPQLEFLIK